MSKEQSSKVEQEPVAYWIPKADQFCKEDTTGRPFAKAWESLYDKPFNAEELVKENNELKEALDLALDALSTAKTYVAGEGFDDEIDQVYDAIKALKKVLKD